MNETCLNCTNKMWMEGPIDDDIQLCHACYSDETLAKYYPEDDWLMQNCQMLFYLF